MTEVKIVPMLPSHLKDLIVHEYIGHIQDTLKEEEYGELLSSEASYSFIVNGSVIGCVGISQCGIYRWHGWALLSKESAGHMISITRLARKELDRVNKPRIETAVRGDFASGHRWAKMLGFKCETPEGMKNYGDDGYDYYMYARCSCLHCYNGHLVNSTNVVFAVTQ